MAEAGGGTERLAPGMDRVMLEWERRHPRDGYVVGVLLRVRGSRPGRERLVDWAAARAPLVPALAEHLDGPARRERWAPFEGFDVARHIHVAGGLRSVSAGEWAVNLPVPADRPRWGLWLLPDKDQGSDQDSDGDSDSNSNSTSDSDSDSHGEDGYRLVYRVHHAAQDGVAAGHTLERLFAGEAPAVPAVALPADSPAAPLTPRTGLVMAVADVPAVALSGIAREAGCTGHDVYLAALAGALRAWRGAAGCQEPVPVRMPFSVRLPSERRDRGNRVGHARVPLPVDEPSAGRRLALIAGRTAAWKAGSARERTRGVQDRMSDRMLLEEFSAFPDADDSLATATSVRIGGPLAFDGDPVTGLTGLPPLYSGHLFTSLLCSYGTRATVCFTARAQDRQVLDLAPLWENALGELAAVRS